MNDDRDKAAIIAICERIGFGRVMQIAAEEWQRRDSIGALTVGPCATFADKIAIAKQARRAGQQMRGAKP